MYLIHKLSALYTAIYSGCALCPLGDYIKFMEVYGKSTLL